jgi:SAM-dependent methyltransferase
MSFFPRTLAAAAPVAGLPIEWEEANCPLCGGRHASGLVEAPDASASGKGFWFAVVQCQDCGLCFTNPRPSLNSIGQFYPQDAYPPYQLPRRKEPLSGWRAQWPWRRTGKDRQLLAWYGQGRLLDFGCGGGSFLKRMGGLGWQVTGLDISATTVCRVRADLGLRVLVGSLPHPELQRESFDVITMWHSLEHVHQPREVLQEAHQLLAPEGKLLVAVPNIDSLAYRWFGPDWYGLDLPRHLTHFTPMTLSLMLERTGFRVGSMRMVRHPKWLRSSAQQASRRRRSPYWHRWLTTKPAARLGTWYSYLTRQADCILAAAFK